MGTYEHTHGDMRAVATSTGGSSLDCEDTDSLTSCNITAEEDPTPATHSNTPYRENARHTTASCAIVPGRLCPRQRGGVPPQG